MPARSVASRGRYRLVRGIAVDPCSDGMDRLGVETTSELLRRQRLRERAEVIARTVLSQQPFLASDACTANQRQLVETMIGAAIWYLPQGPELWTGQISEESLRALAESPDPRRVRLTKEHQFPRKLAAAELLSIDWGTIADPAAEVLHRYEAVYGRFNYVLPDENKRLVRFQKSHRFISPLQAYAEAGILLRSLSPELLKAMRSGDRRLARRVMSGDLC